jgi:hypothetical protein
MPVFIGIDYHYIDAEEFAGGPLADIRLLVEQTVKLLEGDKESRDHWKAVTKWFLGDETLSDEQAMEGYQSVLHASKLGSSYAVDNIRGVDRRSKS